MVVAAVWGVVVIDAGVAEVDVMVVMMGGDDEWLVVGSGGGGWWRK